MRTILKDMVKIVFIPILLFLEQIDYGICDPGPKCDCTDAPAPWGTQDSATIDPCNRYDKDAVNCRKNDCYFRCADRFCITPRATDNKTSCFLPEPTHPGDPRKTCPTHCHDPCACQREPDCEYDNTGNNCRLKKNECGWNLFGLDDCMRPNVFYVEGGLKCKNTKSGLLKNCKVVEQVIAVNLNGNQFYDLGSGITYFADLAGNYEDPQKTRVPGRLDGLDGVDERLMDLYATFIMGNDTLNKRDACISWEFPLTYAGKYEIILKLGEYIHDEPNKRSFRVKFNKVEVLTELDLYKLIGEDSVAADLILQFQIHEERITWPKGFLPSAIANGKSELALCYGNCQVDDPGYIMSAFAIVRYTGIPPEVPPPLPPTSTCDERCQKFEDSVCRCKMDITHTCQYNTATQQCLCGDSYCSQLELELDDAVCRKPGRLLVHGGVVCPIHKQGGNCKMEKLILAVNINGEKEMDREGILFEKDDPKHYVDPDNVRKTRVVQETPEKYCQNISPPEFNERAAIYFKLIHQNDTNISSTHNSSHCVTYLIPMEGKDGRYLLTIKTMDWHMLWNQHISNIKFNNVTILPELDLVKHNGTCRRADFFVHFQIADDGSQMTIAGHPTIPTPPDNIFRLSFCFGDCTEAKDRSYIVSAFSVMELENVGESGDCPRSVPSSGDCDDAAFTPMECRWKDKYYIKNGVPCKCKQDGGNCTIIEQIRVLNLNGDEVTDSKTGITYKSDVGVNFSDPSNTRVKGRLSAPTTGAELEELYHTYVLGDPSKAAKNACLTYDIPMRINGRYELILNFGEFIHDEPDKRSFQVRLNGKLVMSEIDPYKLVGDETDGVDLVLKFELLNKTLSTAKFVTRVENEMVPLSFCYGCENDEVEDRGYIISGFGVVRYTGSSNNTEGPVNDDCDKLENECACHGRKGCEYSIDPPGCISSSKVCPIILKERRCLRKGFFAFAGIVCKNQWEKNCGIEQPIIALNINGDNHTDRNGIQFREESSRDFIFKYAPDREITSYEETFATCEKYGNNQQVKDGDAQLYYSFVHGSSSSDLRNPKNCIYYPITILEDGMYQMGIKFIGTYEDAHYSYFNVLLNNQTILSGFDINRYVKKCHGLDQYIQFRVHDFATTLRIEGTSVSSEIKSRKMNLAFCYGNGCFENDYAIYFGSAFYIARFRRRDGGDPPLEPDPCEQISPGCECRKANCQLKVDPPMCRNSTQYCPPVLEWRKCLPSGYFSHGGVLCEVKGNDICPKDTPIIAINVNGQDHVDRNGINYKAETSDDYIYDDGGRHRNTATYEDSFKTCKNINNNQQVKDGDAELYYTYAHGDKGLGKPNHCIHYPIKIVEPQNGVYELGLKFFETLHDSEHFTVLLNNQIILSWFDIVHYGVRKCRGVDVYAQFLIEDNLLQIEGFNTTSKITDKTINLSFCYGEPCVPDSDPNFSISAFYVSRYLLGSPPSPPPTPPTPTGPPTPSTPTGPPTPSTPTGPPNPPNPPNPPTPPSPITPITPTTAIPSTTPSPSTTPDSTKKPCDEVNATPPDLTKECRCHKSKCQHTHDPPHCIKSTEFCPLVLDGRKCLRKGFFAYNGAICESQIEKKCDMEDPIIAININGDEHTDKSGIRYRKEQQTDYIYKYASYRNLKSYKKTFDNCKQFGDNQQVKDGDAELYYSFVHGWSTRKLRKPGNCIYYPITITEDGFYELGLKFIETYQDTDVSYFNVFLNNQTILSRFDIKSYVPKCMGLDLYLQFIVKDLATTLQIEGLSTTSPISSQTMNLAFCYGDSSGNCFKGGDPNYSASAFYVARIGAPPPPTTPAPSTTPIISTTEPTTVCRPSTPSSGDCEDAPFDIDECRRTHHGISVYYVINGVPCKNTKDEGNCEIKEQLLAVNLNGDLLIDNTTGIEYKSEESVSFSDPQKTRIEGVVSGYITGITLELLPLYSTFITGTGGDAGLPDRCLTYEISIENDGRYGLLLHFGEFLYDEEDARSFIVKFNNMVFMAEIDIYKLIGESDTAATLELKFELENGHVVIADNESSKVENNKIPLSFCDGSNKDECSGRETLSYLVCAFAVVRYPDSITPPRPTTSRPTPPTVLTTTPRTATPPSGPPLTTTPRTGGPLLTTTPRTGGPPLTTTPPTPCQSCVRSTGDCKDSKFAPDECRMNGAFYIKDRKPCKNTKDAGKCAIKEQPLAVNLNGGPLTNQKTGIKYKPEKEVSYKDDHRIRIPGVMHGEVKGTTQDLLPLYSTYISGSGGDLSVSRGVRCITYNVSLKMEGQYALILHLGEFQKYAENQRSFIVKLNRVTFMPEIDIVMLIGKNDTAADIVLNFKLEKGYLVTDMESTKVENNAVPLSFCDGRCSVDEHFFVASAFAVVRYTYVNNTVTTDACEKEDAAPVSPQKNCNCHQKPCEYSVDTGVCGNATKLCPPILAGRSCVRKGFFAYGGVVCTITKHNPCEIDKPLIAINVNGPTHKDKNGITFRKETPSDYIYTYNSKRRTESDQATLKFCKNKTLDYELYYTYAHGWSSENLRHPNNCLHYPITVAEDGMYELGLKFIEVIHGGDISYFTVRLNNQTFLSRFDMLSYIKKKCLGMDVYAHFEVQRVASVLRIEGRTQTSPILGRTINLSFCYGDRSTDCIPISDPNYSISGFYVAKLKRDAAVETCKRINSRVLYHLKECHCHQHMCEFSVETQICGHWKEVCPPIFKGRRCMRPGFFAYGGVVCDTAHAALENCTMEEPLLAININGQAFTDRHGIHFRAERETDYVYKYAAYRRLESYDSTNDTCWKHNQNRQLQLGDTEIYYTYVHGWSSDELRFPRNCIHYAIPIEVDGTYELGLKFLEGYYTSNTSYFNVLLNNQKILSRFDMIQYLPDKCLGMDVYVHFHVKAWQSILQIEGLTTTSKILGSSINLSFCYGDRQGNCYRFDDPNYSISAFYVRRFNILPN